MLDSMLSGEKWSLRPWKKTMEDQLNSWVRFIPGMGDSGELKQLGAFKELLDGFSEAELDNPDLVDGAARERIAKQVCVCEGSAANPILSILLLSFNLLILRYCLLTSSYTSIPLFLYSSIPLYLYI
jgi:hypothetical protein